MGHESGIVNGSRILEHRILVLLVKPWYNISQPENEKQTEFFVVFLRKNIEDQASSTEFES